MHLNICSRWNKQDVFIRTNLLPCLWTACKRQIYSSAVDLFKQFEPRSTSGLILIQSALQCKCFWRIFWKCRKKVNIWHTQKNVKNYSKCKELICSCFKLESHLNSVTWKINCSQQGPDPVLTLCMLDNYVHPFAVVCLCHTGCYGSIYMNA